MTLHTFDNAYRLIVFSTVLFTPFCHIPPRAQLHAFADICLSDIRVYGNFPEEHPPKGGNAMALKVALVKINAKPLSMLKKFD